MFENERGVQVALKGLYVEVLLFLQRIRVVICKECMSPSTGSLVLPSHRLLPPSLEINHREHLSIHRYAISEQRTATISSA